MLRRSPSRNQRSKGFKLNSVLQICVLVAVCVWLLSQARHFQDNISIKGLPEKAGNGHEIVKLGRKDLLPQAKERLSDDQTPHREGKEDPEEEEAGSRAEGNVDEARGAEAEHEETDVRDQDRLEEDDEQVEDADADAEEDSEQEEDFVDEDDKDREEESER